MLCYSRKCTKLTVSGDAGQRHACVSSYNIVLIKQQIQQTFNECANVQQRQFVLIT